MRVGTIELILILVLVYIGKRFMDKKNREKEISTAPSIVTCPRCGHKHEESPENANYCMCPKCCHAFGNENQVSQARRVEINKMEYAYRHAEEVFSKENIGPSVREFIQDLLLDARRDAIRCGSDWDKYIKRDEHGTYGWICLDVFGISAKDLKLGLGDLTTRKECNGMIESKSFYTRLVELCVDYNDSHSGKILLIPEKIETDGAEILWKIR